MTAHSAGSFILVINCGSSSLKFALFSASEAAGSKPELTHLAEGIAEQLESESAELKIRYQHNKISIPCPGASHEEALLKIVEYLNGHFDLDNGLIGIGHRVVHGGEQFSDSVILDDAVVQGVTACSDLAPLHNPANLKGIEIARQAFPTVSQVAVFDTAFHQSMPQHAYTYALPYSLYEKQGLRRYGFHGTSHRYVSSQAAHFLNRPLEKLNLISAHLGNGASVTAVRHGNSVDTSMGMTPLEGLVMGTRSGDIDPGIFGFLSSKGYSADDIDTMLNRESGLLGISGKSNDMRTLIESAESGCPRSQLAIDVFCFRLAKYIVGMMVSLDTLDALIFTGGIGENASQIRQQTINHLNQFGLSLNPETNAQPNTSDARSIHSVNSKPILVIATDEESMIASDTFRLICGSPTREPQKQEI